MDNEIVMSLDPAQIKQLNRTRNAIPFTAIMPHHAGDVLFFGLASKQNRTSFNKIVINRRYVDIIRECAPDITPVILDLTPPNREGNRKTEAEYFWDIVDVLTDDDIKNNFYYFCRASRNYEISDFHLIDQFAFALGSRFLTNADLFCNRSVEASIPLKEIKGPYRILLHFEGGWPLKTYPVKYQQMLLQKLHAVGFEITLLTSNREYPAKYRIEEYKSLAQFKGLLSLHHLLIGLDSFPVHYAAHIASFPAICLFGNTKPANSNAHPSQRYLFLDNDLGCSGCAGFRRCRINGRSECRNFPDPERIFHAAVAMLDGLYLRSDRTGEEPLR